MRSGFSKELEKLVVKYPSNKDTLKKDQPTEDFTRSVFNDTYEIYYFLIFFMKTYVVGTHLNCLDMSRQFKEYPQHVFINQKIKEHWLKS